MKRQKPVKKKLDKTGVSTNRLALEKNFPARVKILTWAGKNFYLRREK